MYAYTAVESVAVEVTTCGSLYDTRLYLFDDPNNLQVCVCLSSGVVGRHGQMGAGEMGVLHVPAHLLQAR